MFTDPTRGQMTTDYVRTTPRIADRVKNMVTLVGVDVSMTGRMAFRLKTGSRASRRAGGSGRVQFNTRLASHGTVGRLWSGSCCGCLFSYRL